MVELHQHSYTLMSHSKALWDTFSRSRKHSRCRKHSSNRCNSNNGNTNIPKTRQAVFQTSEICWRGSAMNCDGVPRSLCVLSLCGWQHVVALGSQAWRPMLQRECLKNVDVKPLVRSVPMQESLEWKPQAEDAPARRHLRRPEEALDLHHQPVPPHLPIGVNCRSKWII